MATVDFPSSTDHEPRSKFSKSIQRLRIRLRGLREQLRSELKPDWAQLQAGHQQLLEAMQQSFAEGCSGYGETAPSSPSEIEGELRDQIGHLEEQIAFLQTELLEAKQRPASDGNSELLQQLRQECEDAHREAFELRVQNASLSDQLASRTGCSTDCLTWEQRKQLLLEQLESEIVCGQSSEQEKLKIEDIIAQSQCEIDRRDAEIEELRKIIGEQCHAHDGLAVGAAAILDVVEGDPLIQQERARLQAMQTEWEAKLRASEIELSRERAKLARERLELENRLSSLPMIGTNGGSNGAKELSPRGNWLARLGLKDQN